MPVSRCTYTQAGKMLNSIKRLNYLFRINEMFFNFANQTIEQNDLHDKTHIVNGTKQRS
jgi:hypothetical protein